MKKLFTPGPVQVSRAVLEAAAQQPLHHRSAEFVHLTQRLQDNLKSIIDTDGEMVIVPGSGTSAIDSAFVSLAQANRSDNSSNEIAVFSHGRFGERFVEMARCYNVTARVCSVAWGETITREMVRHHLQQHPQCRTVWLVHTETSTGVTLPLEELAWTIETVIPKALICVDAVTSLGVEPIEMDAWGIDVLCSGSQKGLASLPGLGILALSNRTIKHLGLQHNVAPYCYSLNLEQLHADQRRQYFTFTPPTNLVSALTVATDEFLANGAETIQQHRHDYAQKIRDVLREHNVQEFGRGNSNALVVFEHPRAQHIVKALDERGVVVVGGQDQLAGNVVRIGTMGAIDASDVEYLCKTLSEVLHEIHP